MPPLVGGDDWTHYAHGPDQNRYSKDDALKYPYLIQWTAKPYYDGKFDIVVAAGGRLFRANVTLAVDNGKPTEGIIARSAYNGNVLWKRKVADDFGTFGSLIVATPEVVYVKDGNGILCLNAETGAELRRFALSGDSLTECKWLALEDGVLVTILGQRPKVKSLRGLPDDLTKDNGDTKDWGNTPHNFGIHRDWFQEYDQGNELVATDVASGKELWRLPANGIDPAKTALAAACVFFYADRSYASCLDLKTGPPTGRTRIGPLECPTGLPAVKKPVVVSVRPVRAVGALAHQQIETFGHITRIGPFFDVDLIDAAGKNHHGIIRHRLRRRGCAHHGLQHDCKPSS
jgi:outer membrane protein assembly factor BamB